MVKLKPCPFCGSKTAYISQNYMGQHYVRCPDCGCTMWGLDTDEEVTEKQAAACWNKRADVRPVVRGKWKKVGAQMHLNLDNAREQYRDLGYPHRNIECLQCSNCRKVSMVDESIRYEFCPHCGADMRPEPPEEGET